MRRIIFAVIVTLGIGWFATVHASQGPDGKTPLNLKMPDLEQQLKEIQPRVDAAIQRQLDELQRRLPEIQDRVEQQLKQLRPLMEKELPRELERLQQRLPEMQQRLQDQLDAMQPRLQEDLQHALQQLDRLYPEQPRHKVPGDEPSGRQAPNDQPPQRP